MNASVEIEHLASASVPVDPAASLTLRVHARHAAADQVVWLDLRHPEGTALPSFSAGAHVAVTLPAPPGVSTQTVRHYSLCNDPAEQHRYCIAVARQGEMGGSAYLHDRLRPGDLLTIAAPRNNFPLREDADRSVLIAGGIGVTPLLAMARRLKSLDRPWTFYYCVQRPERAAFLRELLALGGTVVPVFDGMPGVATLDVAAVVAAAGANDHLYCCGPQGLMRAFEQAGQSRPAGSMHVEWFSAPVDETSVGSVGFDVELARSGRRLHVAADRSLLDTLIEADIPVSYSCNEGLCGTCEVQVIEGAVEHRDVVLSAQEKAQGRMLCCVSRARGLLTLDL